MPMHDQGAKSPVSESNHIPLFYLGGDPASHQYLAGEIDAARPNFWPATEWVVRELRNPYSLRCIAEYFTKVIRENRPRGVDAQYAIGKFFIPRSVIINRGLMIL